RAGSPQKRQAGPPSAAASIHPVVVAVAACMPSSLGVVCNILTPSSAVGSGPVSSTAGIEPSCPVLPAGCRLETSALRRRSRLGIAFATDDRPPGPGRVGGGGARG